MMLSAPLLGADQAKCHHHCDPGRPSARGGDDIYVNTPRVSYFRVYTNCPGNGGGDTLTQRPG